MEKDCRMGLFDLNFCMTDHLHDIMHGQNRMDRMINGTSSSDPQSSQRGELFQTSVQSFDRTPFRAVSFFEFIGRFELSAVPSPQIRIRILELAILFPAFLNPAFVFQRTFIANAVEKNGASFPVFELPEKGFFPAGHSTIHFFSSNLHSFKPTLSFG